MTSKRRYSSSTADTDASPSPSWHQLGLSFSSHAAGHYDALAPIIHGQANRDIKLSNMRGVPAICVNVNGQPVRMRGLTKPMHRCFFPNYKYTGKDKPKIAAARAAKEGLTMLPVDKYLEILSRRKKVKGAALGNKIDEQLRLFVNNTEKFKALEGRVDSTTKDFITAYGYWGWDMSKSQWPVAVPEYRIGTRLDMFGVDRNGRPVLIENKVGFSDYMYRPNGMMKGCLNFYNNCPLHQHRLQVLLESMLVKIMYGVDFGDNCFVVQATPRGIQRYRVPPELTRIKDKIWQQFATYLLESDVREQEKKEQKAEEKKQKREKRKRPKLAVIDVDDQTAVPELPRRKKRRVDTKDAIAV